jgi:hypothetical protein
MRGVTRIALAASLAAGAAASHAHAHRHLHQREAAAVEKREVVTVVHYGPTETVYELDGKRVSEDDAREGLDSGEFAIIGETEPTSVKSGVVTITPSAGRFMEIKATAKVEAEEEEEEEEDEEEDPEPTETPTPSPSPTSTAAAKVSAESKATPSKTPSKGTTGATGIDADFPSGDVPCSTFPSDYGAIPLEWMNLGGWSGIQQVPDYSPGDANIVTIHTAVKGGCTIGSFCSYACPPGYQRTQWPEAQGSTKESIGGLYCNAKGNLELSRDGYTKLCEQGVGGVTIKNDLKKVVSTCRTDYPGTENMVIPLLSEPGSSNPLTNPDSTSYYVWDGQNTTAQYYVNKAGYTLEEACVWLNPDDPGGAGNWAPMNIGVGRNFEMKTYISIFRNKPSSSAELDFNIEITGDGVNGDCSFVNGEFSTGGDGCTVSRRPRWMRPPAGGYDDCMLTHEPGLHGRGRQRRYPLLLAASRLGERAGGAGVGYIYGPGSICVIFLSRHPLGWSLAGLASVLYNSNVHNSGYHVWKSTSFERPYAS